MPHMKELHRRYEDQGLVLIGVHTTKSSEKMVAYVKEEGIGFPVAVDKGGSTVGAYCVDSYPDYYLIDRTGKLRVADLANAEVDRAVKILLDEPVPATAAKSARGRPRPFDFGSIVRKIAKLPELNAQEPLYGLFLFGENGEKRVWAILDRSAEEAKGYDVLYLDLDADGELGEEGERFLAKAKPPARARAKARAGAKAPKPTAVFEIGDFKDPGTGATHKDFKITWTSTSIRYTMSWRGGKRSFGAYGPKRETYVNFQDSTAKAPILVPGYDRPFQFENWMSWTLRRGRENDFKVFVGNRGSVTGAFTTVDDKFLDDSEYVLATLIYKDRNGKEKRSISKLQGRC